MLQSVCLKKLIGPFSRRRFLFAVQVEQNWAQNTLASRSASSKRCAKVVEAEMLLTVNPIDNHPLGTQLDCLKAKDPRCDSVGQLM